MGIELDLIDVVGSIETFMIVAAYFMTQAQFLDAVRWEIPKINLIVPGLLL